MRTNAPKPVAKKVTHEGGKAAQHIDVLAQLERQVATCMLFERTFYASGSTIASDIAEGVKAAVERGRTADVCALAVRARTKYKLRHAPLFLVRELARHPAARPFVDTALAEVIRRPDELAEFLALYWRDGRQPVAACVKRGLALAFQKFNEYQLAKWNRDGAVKLRDALFVCHAKPKDEEQAALWKRLIEGKLATPDTWEVALSSGADKKEAWERLLREQKLGVMALLSNCRNMVEAGCDLDLVSRAIVEKSGGSWALPFRYLSAAKHAPALADALNAGMLAAVSEMPRFSGKTAVVIDVSGSMDVPISDKSTLSRWEAAAALAALAREVMGSCRVFTFSDTVVEVQNVRGFGLVNAIGVSQPHHGTYLRGAVLAVLANYVGLERIIVVTDEQSHDGTVKCPSDLRGYLINVAPEKPALSVDGGWQRINGWSERAVEWMHFHETGGTFKNTEAREEAAS